MPPLGSLPEAGKHVLPQTNAATRPALTAWRGQPRSLLAGCRAQARCVRISGPCRAQNGQHVLACRNPTRRLPCRDRPHTRAARAGRGGIRSAPLAVAERRGRQAQLVSSTHRAVVANGPRHLVHV